MKAREDVNEDVSEDVSEDVTENEDVNEDVTKIKYVKRTLKKLIEKAVITHSIKKNSLEFFFLRQCFNDDGDICPTVFME